MNNFSQTQLANILTFAGFIVYIANQVGFVLEQNVVAYFIGVALSLGGLAYNYYQRFKKGDLKLSGVRK